MRTPPRPIPIIAPFIKVINGIQLVLWGRVDTQYYTAHAGMYESFTMMSDDYALYTPIRFEAL
jgi:hypothetical protein